MKKIMFVAVSLMVSAFGMAQSIDNFEVGPYEVEYKGEGDYRFRMKKGVDLYEYFELKRDTTIQVVEVASEPIRNAFQINISMSMPRYIADGASNVWGIDGSWKHRIGNNLYFNAGLFFAMSYGTYREYEFETPSETDSARNPDDTNGGISEDTSLPEKRMRRNSDNEESSETVSEGECVQESTSGDGEFSETMFEVGIPLSIEWSNLNHKKASLYGGIGVIPTFYTGGKNKYGKSENGFYVAPRLDIGGYVPVKNVLVRIGLFGQYNIDCSGDIFKERIGRLFLGANVGLVF